MIIEFLIWVFVCGGVGLLAGRARGQEMGGLVIGALLGPIGWLLILCSKDLRARCPDCKGVIHQGAVKCCHCGRLTKADEMCMADMVEMSEISKQRGDPNRVQHILKDLKHSKD